jgi:hypothetical protein
MFPPYFEKVFPGFIRKINDMMKIDILTGVIRSCISLSKNRRIVLKWELYTNIRIPICESKKKDGNGRATSEPWKIRDTCIRHRDYISCLLIGVTMASFTSTVPEVSMRKFKSAVLAAFVAASGVFAGVGFQAELGTLNVSDLVMLSGPDLTSTKIGLRVGGSGPTSFDLLLGFGSLSEVPWDDATMSSPYDMQQKYFSFGATIGLAAKVHSGEKTNLSFLGRYGISFSQDGGIYVDAASIPKLDYYTMIFHTIFVGLEPSFKLGENMEIFSNYGVSVKINPNSKTLVQAFPGAPTSWQEMKDGTTGIGFSGILLGFRYNL